MNGSEKHLMTQILWGNELKGPDISALSLLFALCLGGACIFWPGAVCGWNRRHNFYHVHHVRSLLCHTHHETFLLILLCIYMILCVCTSFPVQSIKQLPFLRLAPLLPDSPQLLLYLLWCHAQLWVRHHQLCGLAAGFFGNRRSQ